MGKRGRSLGLVIWMAVVLSGTAWAMPDQEESRIDQVYLNMPELVMYGSGLTVEEVQGAEAYLAQEKLRAVGEPVVFADSGEGICYYVLLDISGSIPNAYFGGMKDAVLSLQEHLRDQDQMMLYTFGDEVTKVFDGTQSSEELERVLAELKNNNQETLLFEAIHQVASESEKMRGDGITRKVLVVMTDGEDFAVGKKQAQEAQTSLRDKGIPVYACGIRDTKKEYLNSFGEFARNSGGDLTVFLPEEGSEMLLHLQDSLMDDIRAEYQAATNLVTYQEEAFSLKLADQRVVQRSVMSDHWIPDHESPCLLSGECIAKQQIRLVFSEPLKGLDGSANYQLTFEGNPVGVTGISYDKGSSSVVNLSLAEPVKNGIYELDLANITDISMEENPVKGGRIQGVVDITVENAQEYEAVETGQTEPFDYTGVLFLIFAAIVALIVLVVVLSRKKKDTQEHSDASALSDEADSQVVLNGGGFQQHVAVEPVPTKTLKVLVSMHGMRPLQTAWELGTSLIVGRSAMSDIHFDDPKMSRQHFCLERSGDHIFITDLNSSNGTMVNGIRIQNRRSLFSGDTIEAGAVKITVRW